MTEPVVIETSSSSRALARKIVIGTVLGAIVFAGLSLYGDVRELKANMEVFAYRAFVLALILAASNYLIRFIRWQYYLRHIAVVIPHGESAIVFLSGFIMSITPGKIGEVFKSLLIYESRGISIARTAPVVVAERLTDLIALVVLIAIGSLSFEGGLSITVSSAIFVSTLVITCSYRPVGEFFIRIIEKIPLTKRSVPKLREAYDSLHEMTRLVPLAVGTIAGTISWGMECVALHIIINGFGHYMLDWDASVFAYSVSTIAGAIAMMPGGLGVTEIGMTGLLQTLGNQQMTPAIATASTMLVRIATLWFAVIIGIAALGIRRLLMSKLSTS